MTRNFFCVIETLCDRSFSRREKIFWNTCRPPSCYVICQKNCRSCVFFGRGHGADNFVYTANNDTDEISGTSVDILNIFNADDSACSFANHCQEKKMIYMGNEFEEFLTAFGAHTTFITETNNLLFQLGQYTDECNRTGEINKESVDDMRKKFLNLLKVWPRSFTALKFKKSSRKQKTQLKVVLDFFNLSRRTLTVMPKPTKW